VKGWRRSRKEPISQASWEETKEEMIKRVGQFLGFVGRRGSTISAVLILVVVLSGVIYSFNLGEVLRWPDERGYYTLASNLASKHEYTHDGIQPTAFRPPGYPFILFLGLSLGAKILHFRFLNFFALGLCMYLVYRIVAWQSGPLAAAIGVVLVGCYAVAFYTAGALLPVIIGSFMFLLVLFLLCRKTSSGWVSLFCGALFGLLILTIPSFLFQLFVVVLWIWFSKNPKRVQVVMGIVIVAFLVVGLWTFRNCRTLNSFVLVSSNSGLNLLLGNSENTTPNAGPGVDISKYEAVASHLNEVQADAYYRSEAIDFVLQNKLEAMQLYFLKVLNYFNFTNDVSTKSEVASWQDVAMLATYGPLLLLFLIRLGMVRWYKPSRFEILLILLYISSAFFSAIFFTRIRFRLPLDFLLIIVVAMFLENILMAKVVRSGARQRHSLEPLTNRQLDGIEA
jgi:hypothetical protein